MGIGWQEILLILLVVLLLFGAKRIPEIAKGLGKGISEFKKAARDAKDEIESETNAAEKKDADKKLPG
jgi:sec-independent protein translocase protein TatA